MDKRRQQGERRHSEERRRFPEANINPDGPRRRMVDRAPGLYEPRLRAPVANGIFYPDSRESIINQIASWGLREGSSAPSPGGKVIIAPHGAWDISGKIAAAAFAALQANEVPLGEISLHGVSRVILLGPSHCNGDQGIYLSESASFQTPLGDLPVDYRMNQKLASCSTLIRENDILHLSEHSLEILLPIIKYCFPAARIVPILVQGNRPTLISGLARALRLTLENYMEQSLIVISSNVSGCYDSAVAFSMADELRSLLSNMDTGGFLTSLSEGRITACGGILIAALLESGLLEGKRFSALTPLAHENEEDGRTVYYCAFAAM